jgi:hypothetical protein
MMPFDLTVKTLVNALETSYLRISDEFDFDIPYELLKTTIKMSDLYEELKVNLTDRTERFTLCKLNILEQQ